VSCSEGELGMATRLLVPLKMRACELACGGPGRSRDRAVVIVARQVGDGRALPSLSA